MCKIRMASETSVFEPGDNASSLATILYITILNKCYVLVPSHRLGER